MKIYVAGPMTGIPMFNFPMFSAVTAELRRDGHEVISPAEEDPEEMQQAAWSSPDGVLHDGKLAGHTWGETLARDVKLLADHGVECIYLLPGWERSKGARLEAFVGLLCGLTFKDHSFKGKVMSREWVMAMIAKGTLNAEGPKVAQPPPLQVAV